MNVSVFFMLYTFSLYSMSEIVHDKNYSTLVDEGERLLKLGSLKEGFNNLEYRLFIHQNMPSDRNLSKENFDHIKDKKILIRLAGGISAQRKDIGLGDIFIFLRYAIYLKQFGAEVVLEMPKPLLKFVSRCLPVMQNSWINEVTVFDFQIAWASLPTLIYDPLVRTIPYLYPDPNLVHEWKQRLNLNSQLEKLNVGICWRASNLPPFNRNIPLSSLKKLLQLKNIQLYSLQSGITESPEEIKDVNLKIFPDLDTNNGPFEDSAALIDIFDAIVTVDTSLLGLCGAMGSQKTYGLLPADCDWRWGSESHQSLWFPSLYLIRQTSDDAKNNDWSNVMDQVYQKLQNLIK